MTITTSNALPAPMQAWFDNVLLSRPMPGLIHKIPAMKKKLPPNSGRIARYRRYANLKTATVPLPDSGLTPPGQVLNAIDIDARADFYGTYTTITDTVMFINQDPVLNQTVSLLAQSMRETEDELLRNTLEGTASVINATHGVNGDNPCELNRQDLDSVIRALINSSAMMISDNIPGTLKFGTSPVREAFIGMMNSNIIDDLESVTGFISQAQYPSSMNIFNNEWGSVSNVRFLYSPLGSVSPGASLNGEDVYNIFITGTEAYAMIDLTQATASFIYTPPGGSTDPLRRLQIGAWKKMQATRLLNDRWIYNFRVTHS